jgi:hypothetical protein
MGGLRSNISHHGRIVASQPPQMRTIIWQDGMRHHLMFPHALYVMYYTRGDQNNKNKYWLNRLHVAFSQTPFTFDPNDRLSGLPLANYDMGLAICFYEWPVADDPKEFADKVIAQYWSSPFQDYQDSFSHWLNCYRDQEPTFWQEWVAASKTRKYDWMIDQSFLQAPYIVSLKKLFDSNKTLTEEIEYFPNINVKKKLVTEDAVRALAHQKWIEADSPSDPQCAEQFWMEAEKELNSK